MLHSNYRVAINWIYSLTDLNLGVIVDSIFALVNSVFEYEALALARDNFLFWKKKVDKNQSSLQNTFTKKGIACHLGRLTFKLSAIDFSIS